MEVKTNYITLGSNSIKSLLDDSDQTGTSQSTYPQDYPNHPPEIIRVHKLSGVDHLNWSDDIMEIIGST